MTYHVPYSALTDGLDSTHLQAGSTGLTFPRPDPSWLGELARSLGLEHQRLEERTTAAVLRTLDGLNARWADPGSAERQEADALLAAATGYPTAVIRPALDQ